MNCLKQGVLGAAMMLTAVTLCVQPAQAQPCEQVNFDKAGYIICTVEPGNAGLRLFWKNADGKPYRYFSNIAGAVAKEGRTLAFAVNAGMYQPDFSPMGLYVENGRELRPANRAVADSNARPVPNFYKNPNGVFFLGDSGGGILPTDKFLKRGRNVEMATQSGPMLVIGNKLNPIFIVGSTDKTRRSGVGICGNGVIRFAISESAVNFHDFARLFRDRLKCPDALFLDGGGGVGIYSPAMGRNDWSWHGGYGPIFGFVE